MTYQPGIPNLNDAFPSSSLDLKNNFTSINDNFQKNHIALNAASNQGKHTALQLIGQGAPPTTASDEVGLYSANTGTRHDLIFRSSGNGTVSRITGGEYGIAAYTSFSGTTPIGGPRFAPTVTFNVDTIEHTNTGTYNIQFLRYFTGANSYVAIIVPIIAQLGSQTPKIVNINKTADNFAFVIQNQSNGALDALSVECAFFGLLK